MRDLTTDIFTSHTGPFLCVNDGVCLFVCTERRDRDVYEIKCIVQLGVQVQVQLEVQVQLDVQLQVQ
jgi:hypothetical protein